MTKTRAVLHYWALAVEAATWPADPEWLASEDEFRAYAEQGD